jgi:4-amino-4-deoxy-L-arabinose transferase-like glycosyltransferase
MALEPYLVGIDRWFHLTSLEAYFGFTAILFLLVWVKDKKDKNLIFSGIFYALAILSKVSALLILPIFLLVVLIEGRKNSPEAGDVVKNFSLFFLATLATGLILFPSLVVDFMGTLENIFNGTKNVSIGQSTYPLVTGWQRIFFYDLILLFKLSPITIILFLYSLLQIEKIRKDIYLSVVLLGFVFYYIFLSFFPKKIDRYIIAMFPYILLLASYSLTQMRTIQKRIFLFLIIAYIVFVSYLYYPVYSSYYSPLFGGAPKAIEIGLYDNSGEYFSDAAFYLNDKGRNTKVWVPNGVISFQPYFKGKLVKSLTDKPNYVVVSYDSSRKQLQNYGCEEKEKSFGSKEYDIVHIYKCSQF